MGPSYWLFSNGIASFNVKGDRVRFVQPAWYIPLWGEDFAILGRFAAIMGQFDTIAKMLFYSVSRMDERFGEIAFQNMSGGSLLALLRLAFEWLPEGDEKDSANDYVKKSFVIIDKRNHIMHGMWGYNAPKSKWGKFHPENDSSVRTAIHFFKSKEKPVFSSDLPDLCDKASEATFLGFRLLVNLGLKGHGTDYSLWSSVLNRQPYEHGEIYWFGPDDEVVLDDASHSIPSKQPGKGRRHDHKK